jgi:hypothetical protein
MAGLNYKGKYARRASVEWEAGIEYVSVGASFWAPARFVVTVKDARYPVQLDVEIRNGRAECLAVSAITREVRLDNGIRATGPPLTGALLRRLRLESLLREATFAIASERQRLPREVVDPLRKWATPDKEGNVEVIAPVRGRRGGEADFMRAYPRPTPKRGARVTLDELRRAAEIYLRAEEVGESTAEAIAKQFHIEESTARKWVMKARAAHLLPPSNRELRRREQAETELRERMRAMEARTKRKEK